MNFKRWKRPPSAGSELLDFRYSRLRGRNSIRLAVIKPGNGNKGVAINLVDSFVHGPNQRAHTEYDALSYTWGEKVQDKAISCNGRRMCVTPTLLEALKHFRHATREVTLWIDQICICQDQDHISERNQQVQMMGEIFKGARKVSVWLGGHYDDSRAGMQLADQLLSISKIHASNGLDVSHLETYSLPRQGHKKWVALAAILRRPWFWRTWIVQEVVLNDNVEIVLGDSSLMWEDLESIVELLEGPSPRRWHVDLTMSAWELPFSRINRIRLRHKRKQLQPEEGSMEVITSIHASPDKLERVVEEMYAQDELDLLDLLLLSRDLGATDPRDKVYALLGLTTHEIKPDYTSSPEHIFNEFALHVIGEVTRLPSKEDQDTRVTAVVKEVRKALMMLSCAGRPNQARDLPSWTPDWSASLLYRPLVFDSRFCAGGDIMEMDWDHETGLRLCGKLIDTIAFSGRTHLGHETVADPHAAIRDWWDECKRISDARIVRSPGSTGHVDAFDALRRDLGICEHGYFRDETVDPSRPVRFRRRGSLLNEVDRAEQDEHNAHQTLTLGPTRGRVMIATTTGFLGLAPYGALEGDLVYVVLGASVPFVLRPRLDGALILIGEAYIQGVMNGEFLAMDRVGGVVDLFIQ